MNYQFERFGPLPHNCDLDDTEEWLRKFREKQANEKKSKPQVDSATNRENCSE